MKKRLYERDLQDIKAVHPQAQLQSQEITFTKGLTPQFLRDMLDDYAEFDYSLKMVDDQHATITMDASDFAKYDELVNHYFYGESKAKRAANLVECDGTTKGAAKPVPTKDSIIKVKGKELADKLLDATPDKEVGEGKAQPDNEDVIAAKDLKYGKTATGVKAESKLAESDEEFIKSLPKPKNSDYKPRTYLKFAEPKGNSWYTGDDPIFKKHFGKKPAGKVKASEALEAMFTNLVK